MAGALEGIRVLDIGTRIGAPFAATLLAELGADVIKIEDPAGGDPMRALPPFDGERSLFWAVEGRGKRSMTLDLSQPRGQEIFRKLAAISDVVVENFRPGTLERWNIGPDVLRALNARLVVSRVSVYGQDGPYRDRPGLDRNGIALGGLLYITGYPDRPPVRPGVIVADYLTALFNTVGILAALVERAHSGEGQSVELSLYESVLRVMEWTIAAYDRLGVVRERTGNRLANSAPLDNYPTADGRYVCIVAAGDAIFPRLARAIGRPELLDDQRFASVRTRAEHAEEINDIVAAWCAQRSQEEIERILVDAQVPVSGVYDVAQIFADEHVRARGSIIEVSDPVLGAVRQQAPVPRLSRTPPSIPQGAPELGSATYEILRGLLEIPEHEIAALVADGII